MKPALAIFRFFYAGLHKKTTNCPKVDGKSLKQPQISAHVPLLCIVDYKNIKKIFVGI